MRTSVKIISALSVAGLALAAGSAFTTSNDFTGVSLVSGYGQVVATGATITAVSDTLLSTDHSKLDSVVFTSSTDVTGKTVSMTLKNGTSVVGNYTCNTTTPTTAWASGTMQFTCSTATSINGTTTPLLSDFDTTGLTVL